MDENVTVEGLDVKLRRFRPFYPTNVGENETIQSKIDLDITNLGNSIILLKFDGVLLDDLDNQYELFKSNSFEEIKEVNIYPDIKKTGSLFFDKAKIEAKSYKLILIVSERRYDFEFKPFI